MITITVHRKWYTQNSTIGELYIDGVFFCFTLEDYCRDLNHDGKLSGPAEQKVMSATCIPAGMYPVIIDISTRFKKPMPHILNVPGFEGIRIHNGNTSKDTDGCLLLGNTHSTDFVGNSVATFNMFFIRLRLLLSKYQVQIIIIDASLNPLIN